MYLEVVCKNFSLPLASVSASSSSPWAPCARVVVLFRIPMVPLQVGLQRQAWARARAASVRCQTDCARPGRDNGRVLRRQSSTATWPALCAAAAGVLLAGVLLIAAAAEFFVRVPAEVDP